MRINLTNNGLILREPALGTSLKSVVPKPLSQASRPVATPQLEIRWTCSRSSDGFEFDFA